MPDDKEKIPNGDALLRRIHPKHIVDDSAGGKRLSSGAFRDPEMSVDVEPMLASAGLDWTFSVKDHPTHWLVRFTAGFAREKGQFVLHRPLPENGAHAEVTGKKSGAICDAFRSNAEWVKKPPDVR